MRFEVSYQCDHSQAAFDEANPETGYCVGEKTFKQAAILAEAKKFGHGILHVVNGKDVLEMICF